MNEGSSDHGRARGGGRGLEARPAPKERIIGVNLLIERGCEVAGSWTLVPALATTAMTAIRSVRAAFAFAVITLAACGGGTATSPLLDNTNVGDKLGAAEAERVLVFGDSNAYGIADGLERAGVDVRNEAVGFCTLGSGTYLEGPFVGAEAGCPGGEDWRHRLASLDFDPTHVVLHVGAADMAERDGHPQAFEWELRAGLEWIDRVFSEAEVVAVTLPRYRPVDPSLEFVMDTSDARTVNRALRSVADTTISLRALGVPHSDDGMHYTDRGYDRIAATVGGAL